MLSQREDRVAKLPENQSGLLKVIEETDASRNYLTLRDAAYSLIGLELNMAVSASFWQWTDQHGIVDPYIFPEHLPKFMNMAHALAQRYDLGVAISRGGLHGAYIFSRFQPNVAIVDAHKHDNSFRWITSVPELKDARILVFDKDVISGKTSERVFGELQKYGPKYIDLALAHDNDDFPGGWPGKSQAANVAKGYRNVYWPGKMNYARFGEALDAFRIRIY